MVNVGGNMSENASNLKWLVIGDVEPPKRNSGLDAGWDLFIPKLTQEYAKILYDKNPGDPINWSVAGPGPKEGEDPSNGWFLQINPGQALLIPLQIHARFDPDWVLIVHNKSGVCTKQRVSVGAEVVDSSYQGELHAHVINDSPNPRFLQFGQKVAQAVIHRHDPLPAEVWMDENLKFNHRHQKTTIEKFHEGQVSERGDKGFGHATGGGAPIEEKS